MTTPEKNCKISFVNADSPVKRYVARILTFGVLTAPEPENALKFTQSEALALALKLKKYESVVGSSVLIEVDGWFYGLRSTRYSPDRTLPLTPQAIITLWTDDVRRILKRREMTEDRKQHLIVRAQRSYERATEPLAAIRGRQIDAALFKDETKSVAARAAMSRVFKFAQTELAKL